MIKKYNYRKVKMSLDLDEIERIDKEWDNPLGIVEENGKRYIDGEEILLELKLVPAYDIFIKTFLFICCAFGAFAILDKGEYNNFIAYIVIFIFIYFSFIIINVYINIYRYKLYITENYFITHRGIKVHKDDIYILIVSSQMHFWGGRQWKFYNEKYNIFDYFTGSSDDVDAFNRVIYKVSKNKYFYLDPKTFTYTKRHVLDGGRKFKLTKKGEN